MNPIGLQRIPARDPVSGGELHITELASEDSGITIRGKFEVPRYARLDADQTRFLETFLRCRGMFNAVERELGMSYPTVKARLESLLQALDLTPIEAKTAEKAADKTTSKEAAERRARILDRLSAGEITAEEAKTELRAGGVR